MTDIGLFPVRYKRFSLPESFQLDSEATDTPTLCVQGLSTPGVKKTER